MKRNAAGLASLLALGACTTDEPEPAGDPIVSHVATGQYNMAYQARTDVLFVVDTSPASAALLPQVRAIERTMLERLATFDYGQLANVHVGVVTTDLADQGRLREGRYLADELQFDEQRHRNYDGAFVETALELLDAGSAGSADRRPVAALQMALSPSVNPGFRRASTPLAVIFVTSGDDGDPRSIEELRTAFGTTLVSVLGACGATLPRLDAITGGHIEVCDADPARGIEIAAGFKQTLEGRCLPGLLADVDPTTPGVQHECSGVLLDPLTGASRRFEECSATRVTGCWAPKDGYYGGCDPGLAMEFRPSRLQYPARAEIECVVESASSPR